MSELDLPDIVDDSIALVYSQYRDRFVPSEDEITNPRTQNNIPEFLNYNLSNEFGRYGPDDLVNQSYRFLINSFNIDVSAEITSPERGPSFRIPEHNIDLDNIGAILHQPRPFLENACYMTPTYAAPPYSEAITGTPWGTYPEPSPSTFVPNCPWFFQNDPVNVAAPVTNVVYARALHCVAYKYFSSFQIGNNTYPSWNVASLVTMIYTLFILMKTPERTTFEPSNITIAQDATDPLEWTINFMNIGTVTDNDRALVEFVNPDGTMIWSRMAGLTVNFPQFTQ